MSQSKPPSTPAPPPAPRRRSPERWGTRFGVILAVTGSAVGLGNFLRFPGLAAQYEGGAFMIPYFIALFVLGLPLAWGEWAMGRYGGRHGYNSTPGIYRAIWKSRLAPYAGVLGLIVPVIVYMFYVLIESWCLGYAWQYLSGAMAELGQQARPSGAAGPIIKEPYEKLFAEFTGSGENGQAIGRQGLLFLLLCFSLNFALIYRGLSKGIELFCLIAMPALIVCAVLVLIRVLTLPNIGTGLGFMWNPRGGGSETDFWPGFWRSLINPDMWLAATGQIFFTLSVGFGVIITYSSYLKPDDDIALSSLSSAAGNQFCEVALGGMIVIPAAFIFLGATTVTAAAGSSFDLGFKTLPMVFESMPLGYIVGFLFFFLLFLAAVTSSLSMLQPAIALLEEGLGVNRGTSVSILGFVTLSGACFVLYFSQGLAALGTFDFWVGTFGIFVLALVQAILFGWALGPKRGMAELDRGSELRVPRLVGFVLRWVAPIYLSVIFVAWIVSQVSKKREDNALIQIYDNPVVKLSLGFIVMVAAFLLLVIHQAVRRWDREERAATEVQI